MGLKATGSKDIHVNDVFVPEYRTHKQSAGFNLTNPGYEETKTIYIKYLGVNYLSELFLLQQ